MRGILIFTCSAVSFSHGTNDGQKSIGLIMLTIIGIFPATYALNPTAQQSLHDLAATMQQTQALIRQYGDDEKDLALTAIGAISRQANASSGSDTGKHKLEVGPGIACRADSLGNPRQRLSSHFRTEACRGSEGHLGN